MARSFAARDMPLCGMYTQTPKNFQVGPPPLTNHAYAPGYGVFLIKKFLFKEYIGRISALIEESPTSNITIVGDFNAALDTQFEAELQEFCNNLSLVISDCMFYGRTSGKFTHVSDAHGTT